MDTNMDEFAPLIAVQHIISQSFLFVMLLFRYYRRLRGRRRRQNSGVIRYSLVSKIPSQVKHIRHLVELDDEICVNHLRMNRAAFAKLCYLVEHRGGLARSRRTSAAEKLAMFLFVLSHHTKNRIVLDKFGKSAETVSRCVNEVLKAVLKLHPVLIATPEPVDDTCSDERWRYFKGCIGALDGTHVEVMVGDDDKPRYRNRKGTISINVLGVCDCDVNFIYVLSGWEGSAADGRILRDAVTRANGLKVPRGNYYLCDAGYTNGDGFLTPHRNVRYHLKEWGRGRERPQNWKEYFNLKHSKVRNIIERAFGALKTRWAILRSKSWYPIGTHNRMILACALLHNYIRREMDIDPIEHLLDEIIEEVDNDDVEYVESVETSPQWDNFRDQLGQSMWNEYRSGHRH